MCFLIFPIFNSRAFNSLSSCFCCSFGEYLTTCLSPDEDDQFKAMSSSLSEWVSKNFDIPSITPQSVSRFINPEFDISEWLTPLTTDELLWMLVYDIVEFKKYSTLKLSTPEKMFLASARNEFESITNTIEIRVDLNELWKKSGN